MMIETKKHIRLLAAAFDVNPSVNWVIKNDRFRKKRILALSDYSYKTAFIRQGIALSSDQQGIALCYRYNSHKTSLSDYWNQIQLIFRAIGISRTKEILRREHYLKRHRPASGDFLYFWFLGVNPEARGSGSAKELKDRIFHKSRKEQLPIYLETSVERNKNVYQRYGFEIYHTWNVNEKLTLWMMKRDWDK